MALYQFPGLPPFARRAVADLDLHHNPALVAQSRALKDCASLIGQATPAALAPEQRAAIVAAAEVCRNSIAVELRAADLMLADARVGLGLAPDDPEPQRPARGRRASADGL